MKTVYLSLGSNIGDREKALRDALAMLEAADLKVTRTSSVYETEPMDVRGQARFLNLVAEVETDIFPLQLLMRIEKIERALGRKRVIAKGPRTIDIDIVLFSRFAMETPKLTIPHPRMTERRFVLEPLAELAPELRHPVTKETVREMLAKVAGRGVRKIEPR